MLLPPPRRSSNVLGVAETDVDAIAAVLTDAFVDDMVTFKAFADAVVSQRPHITEVMLRSILDQFQDTNKVFIDGEDIFRI